MKDGLDVPTVSRGKSAVGDLGVADWPLCQTEGSPDQQASSLLGLPWRCLLGATGRSASLSPAARREAAEIR